MIVNIFNQQLDLKISSDQVKKLAQHVISSEGYSCDEVNIYFVNNATICHLHEVFFHDSSPTDCISLPMDEDEPQIPYRILGEIFVCPKRAIIYAEEHQLDCYEETSLYLVHSLLHLMGYDDLDNQDRQRMRKAEASHMKDLKKLNLQLT